MKKLFRTLVVTGIVVSSFGFGVSFAYAQVCSVVPGGVGNPDLYVCQPANSTAGCTVAGDLMSCPTLPAGYSIANQAVATFFTAEPTIVNRDDDVTLAWQTQNAVGCSIEGTGEIPSSGTRTVNPQRSTTFVLSCRDASAGALSGEPRTLSSVSVTVTEYVSSTTVETRESTNITYVPLEPLKGLEEAQSGTGNFGELLQGFFRLLVNIGAFIAVTVLVIGGITYMVSEATVNKFIAKEKIKAAFWGLAILAGAWLILNTINPNLLTFRKDLVDPKPSFITVTRPATFSLNGVETLTLSDKQYDLLAKEIGCATFLDKRTGCLRPGVLIYDPDPAFVQTSAFRERKNEFTQECTRLSGFRVKIKLGQVIERPGTEIAYCTRI